MPVFQGLAELKELAGVDKDLDEEEDLGLLEQEASMPLHELLAKMKEVRKHDCNFLLLTGCADVVQEGNATLA